MKKSTYSFVDDNPKSFDNSEKENANSINKPDENKTLKSWISPSDKNSKSSKSPTKRVQIQSEGIIFRSKGFFLIIYLENKLDLHKQLPPIFDRSRQELFMPEIITEDFASNHGSSEEEVKNNEQSKIKRKTPHKSS